MTHCFDFRLEGHGLDDVRFVFQRARLPDNGDFESAFLDGIADLRRHTRDTPLACILAEVCKIRGTAIVVVIRNPNLVLDAGLRDRIGAAIAALPDPDEWSIAGAGGLGLAARRHLALYATAAPAIPDPTGPHPLLDVMPDLYLVNAAFAGEILATGRADHAIETILAVEGYLAGRVALYLPGLASGIDGDLRARDLSALSGELQKHFGMRMPGATIATLTGPVRLAESREAGSKAADLGAATAAAISRHATPLSLSIVVRTRFERNHLLERLLTTISRARQPGTEIEVILSSDAEAGFCRAEAARLAALFRSLDLRLQHNETGLHSRVGNLIGGLRAARKDHVVAIDDDDYVDLFAFDCIAPARFGGACPIIVTGTELHEEQWEETPSGRWVLAASRRTGEHAADGWRDMFTGVNRLPVCAMILPRTALIDRLDRFTPEHDLSEDYALFLLVLTDPALPEIVEVAQTFCHVSIRGTENSVTMPDRRPWARDIAAHLTDLTRARDVAGPGKWLLLRAAGTTTEPAADAAIADLRRALTRAEANLRLLRRENDQLRNLHQPEGV